MPSANVSSLVPEVQNHVWLLRVSVTARILWNLHPFALAYTFACRFYHSVQRFEVPPHTTLTSMHRVDQVRARFAKEDLLGTETGMVELAEMDQAAELVEEKMIGRSEHVRGLQGWFTPTPHVPLNPTTVLLLLPTPTSTPTPRADATDCRSEVTLNKTPVFLLLGAQELARL